MPIMPAQTRRPLALFRMPAAGMPSTIQSVKNPTDHRNPKTMATSVYPYIPLVRIYNDTA